MASMAEVKKVWKHHSEPVSTNRKTCEGGTGLNAVVWMRSPVADGKVTLLLLLLLHR